MNRSQVFSSQDKGLFIHNLEKGKRNLTLLPAHLVSVNMVTPPGRPSQRLNESSVAQCVNSVFNSLFANYSYNAFRQVRVYLILRSGNLQLGELNVSLSASGELAQAI